MSADRALLVLAATALLVAGTFSNAQAGSVTLSWTAPGGDGLVGRAAVYDLRYSATMLTPETFASATPVQDMPVPGPAGSPQSVTVSGLKSGAVYFFAIKSADSSGNWSAMSNVVSRTPVDAAHNPTPATLSFSAPAPNPAQSLVLFSVALPADMVVSLDVFDIAGRRVRSLAEGLRPAGTTSLTLDLFDDHGVRLAEGLYLVRARLGATVITRRLVVAR